MTRQSTFDEVLDFAIAGEESDSRFYRDFAIRMTNKEIRKVFEEFAEEELGHKAKLEDIKRSGVVPLSEAVIDLKIGDYMVEKVLRPDMDYQDVLVLAMQKEKAAFKLYSDMSKTTQDKHLRKTFLMLAQEEAKHKLRFEIEYDEAVLKDD